MTLSPNYIEPDKFFPVLHDFNNPVNRDGSVYFPVKGINPEFSKFFDDIKSKGFDGLDLSCLGHRQFRFNNMLFSIESGEAYEQSDIIEFEDVLFSSYGYDGTAAPIFIGSTYSSLIDPEQNPTRRKVLSSFKGSTSGVKCNFNIGSSTAVKIGPRFAFAHLQENTAGREGAWRTHRYMSFIDRNGELIERKFKPQWVDTVLFDDQNCFLQLEDGEEDIPETVSTVRIVDRTILNAPTRFKTTLFIQSQREQVYVSHVNCSNLDIFDARSFTLTADIRRSSEEGTCGVYPLGPRWGATTDGDSFTTGYIQTNGGETLLLNGIGASGVGLKAACQNYIANETSPIPELTAACQAILDNEFVIDWNDVSTRPKSYIPLLNESKKEGPVFSSFLASMNVSCLVTANQNNSTTTSTGAAEITNTSKPPISFGCGQFGNTDKVYVGREAVPGTVTLGEWADTVGRASTALNAFNFKANFKVKRSGSVLFETDADQGAFLISTLFPSWTITSGDTLEVTVTGITFLGEESSLPKILTAVPVVSPTGFSFGSISGTTGPGQTLTLPWTISNTPDPPIQGATLSILISLAGGGAEVAPYEFDVDAQEVRIILLPSSAAQTGDAFIIGGTLETPHNGVSVSGSGVLP